MGVSRELSSEFIKTLLKKAEANLVGANHTFFTEDERKLMRSAVRDKDTKTIKMRERTFRLKRFRHRDEDWVTISPVSGFVPMISGPVSYILDTNKEH